MGKTMNVRTETESAAMFAMRADRARLIRARAFRDELDSDDMAAIRYAIDRGTLRVRHVA